MSDILEKIRDNKHRGLLQYSEHAWQRMVQRLVRSAEVESALNAPQAEVVEDYAHDPRGASCLLRAPLLGRELYLVVGYARDVIVTVYEPEM